MEEGDTRRALLTGEEVVEADADKEQWLRRVSDIRSTWSSVSSRVSY